MSDPIKIEGVQQTLRRFERLPRRVQRRVLPKAVRAGGTPYVQTGRRLVPRRNGTLKRSLALVIRRYSGAVVAVVGQEKTKRLTAKKLKHRGGISGRGDVVPIHLVENPVKPHTIRPRGQWLKFSAGGQVIYARRVHHPGHGGSGALARASRQAKATSMQNFEHKFTAETDKETTKLASET